MQYKSLEKLPAVGVSHNPEIKKQVFLEKGEVPHLTQLARAIFKPGQIAEAHEHSDMYEIFNIEDGSGKIVIDNQEYPLKKGVCVVVEPNEKHEIQNTSQNDLIVNIIGILKL